MREKIIGIELIKEAMKSGDKIRLQVVKNLKSDIIREEGGQKQLTDVQIVNKIKKDIENLNQIISASEKIGNRNESILESKKEIEILESFLPKQMTDSEITSAIDEILTRISVTNIKDMGRIMGVFNSEYGGRADNKLVSTIIKSKLI